MAFFEFLAINDRVDDGHELMQEVFSAKDDLSVFSRYILYLEVDLLPDDILDEVDALISGEHDV